MASVPPAKPSSKPGRSAIAKAMYPAATGPIRLKALLPTAVKNAASGVLLPKVAVPRLTSSTR